MLLVCNENVKIERLTLGQWQTNAYIIVCQRTKISILIDAPAEAETILRSLEGTSPIFILMTHNHFDHTGALSDILHRLKVDLAAHAADAKGLPCPPEILLNDGQAVHFGKVVVEVIHTPGHTPGSLCFKIGNYLFSGDTIFPGGPGKTVSPAAFSIVVKSIAEKIMVLPDDTSIYPGHGDSTVLKKEREQFSNFLSREHDPAVCGDVLWLES